MATRNTITFSIVIPTLNEEKYLPLLLKDLKRQQEKNFEVIVVDGSSVDKTKEVAMTFSDSLSLQYITVKKRNVAYQRNFGASKAKGKYILFLDADSRVYATLTKKLDKAIVEKKALLYLPSLTPDEPTQRNLVIFKFINSTIELSHTFGKPLSAGAAIFIDRHLFHLIGGFDEIRFVSEDHALVQRAYDIGIKTRLLKDIKVVFCMRRIKKEGEMAVLSKYIAAIFYMVIKGDSKKKLFTYNMGGQEYANEMQHGVKKRGFTKFMQEYLN